MENENHPNKIRVSGCDPINTYLGISVNWANFKEHRIIKNTGIRLHYIVMKLCDVDRICCQR